MNDAQPIDEAIDDMASRAANAAKDADLAIEDAVDQITRPKADVEDTLADAVTSIRKAIAAQPMTAVFLVGAFAFLWGMSRRA
jgi:hypothetical protein